MKSRRGDWLAPPSQNSVKSCPSPPGGVSAPPAESSVWYMSSVAPISADTLPAGTLPGHLTMNGTRTPPSYVECLAPRKGPGDPACQGLTPPDSMRSRQVKPRPVVAGEDHDRVLPLAALPECPQDLASGPIDRLNHVRRRGRHGTFRETAQQCGAASAACCMPSRQRTVHRTSPE